METKIYICRNSDIKMEETQSILDLYAEAYKEENYPPVAGKMVGLFFTSNQKYFTFEELMEGVGASKSATSKALKLLIDFGEVNYKTLKDNKRKRYFYLDIKGNLDRIQRYIDGFKMQTRLFRETLKLRNEEDKEVNQFIEELIEFHSGILQFVDNNSKNRFKKTLQSINK
ncbi:GbsR/MarR family transcriptional regulator [Aquimarina algiphila]|uniref:GbsR/MarR family transcriptional regulator n=1 Tax=Aquimarina algiphila TaxID=2047982 RepID=UPI002490AF8E|nr:hypothetical protein [Aquimarina algiphila]